MIESVTPVREAQRDLIPRRRYAFTVSPQSDQLANVRHPRHFRDQLVLDGQGGLAGSIAALEFATKIVWYYLHERVWAAAPWGPAPAFRNSGGEGFRTVTASNTMDARFQTVRVGFNYHFN